MTEATRSPGSRVDVSIIVPLFNEQENVEPLYREIIDVIDTQPLGYEVIFIDDGSTDETLPRLRELVGSDPRVTLLVFTKNFGQTASTAAGIDHARGDVLVPMDGDLQNDPRDIPALVAKLDEEPGWDIVSGWRKNRQDRLLSRRLPSILANRLIKRLTWTTEIHDFGCSLKAYRREVLEDVRLYGEMHRFLPAVCKWRGARITEQVVNHRPRVAGISKYGLKRSVKVLLDLLTVKFLGDYLVKPIYFFGKIAALTLVISFASLGVAIAQKFGFLTGGEGGLNLNRNVLVLFSTLFFLISVILLLMGVLAELIARIYHESQDRKPYKIRTTYPAAGGESPGPAGPRETPHAG